MKKVMLIICAVFSTAFSAYLDGGRHEIGGGLSFNNYSQDGKGKKLYQVSPFYNYYFSNNFFIGPIVSIIGIQDEAQAEVGFRIGIGMQGQRAYVYFSPGFTYVTVSHDNASAIPLTAGCKTLLAKHFGMDTSIGFTPIFRNSKMLYNFGIAVGFFGLL